MAAEDGGGRHLEKSKIAISRPRFDRFRRHLAPWRSLALLGVPTL